VPGPDLPESIGTLSVRDDRPTTVAAVNGNDRWRTLKRAGQDGTSYIVALPLDTVDRATAARRADSYDQNWQLVVHDLQPLL